MSNDPIAAYSQLLLTGQIVNSDYTPYALAAGSDLYTLRNDNGMIATDTAAAQAGTLYTLLSQQNVNVDPTSVTTPGNSDTVAAQATVPVSSLPNNIVPVTNTTNTTTTTSATPAVTGGTILGMDPTTFMLVAGAVVVGFFMLTGE